MKKETDMDRYERAALAVDIKTSGRGNCAQAVAAALADRTALAEDTLRNLTAGFCAGMGTMDATCGALISAGMIAGAATNGQGTLRCARAMLERFRELSGAVTCRDLKTGAGGRPLCPCEDCVKNAVLAYCEVMDI